MDPMEYATPSPPAEHAYQELCRCFHCQVEVAGRLHPGVMFKLFDRLDAAGHYVRVDDGQGIAWLRLTGTDHGTNCNRPRLLPKGQKPPRSPLRRRRARRKHAAK